MTAATIRRHELGLKHLNFPVTADLWHRATLNALNSNPPLKQAEYLRRIIAAAGPIIEPAPAEGQPEAQPRS